MFKITSKFALAAIRLISLPGLVVLASEPAWADVVQDFNLSGIFQLQTPGLPTSPFSAQVAIDTTTGTVTSENLFPSNVPFPSTVTQGYNAAAQAYLLLVNDTIDQYQIFFDTVSLVNYAGGNLGSLDNPTPGGAVSNFNGVLLPGSDLLSGTASVTVPEPASGGLLAVATAAMAMLLTTRRRDQGGTQRG